MGILRLAIMPSQRDSPLHQRRAHAPRLVPAEETDDEPGQVPDFADGAYALGSAFTVAGTAPDSNRLPFEPPPAGRRS